ncbi:MAG TPA: MoxR family ATPase [Phycisphaerales bacterium]|nr:MoxR family ATPase [Phycisphaerales bacterium]
MSPDELQALGERFRKDYAAVRSQIGRVIVGNQSIIDGVLVCLFTGGHALLEGVPGIGKTLLIRSLSQALNLEFSRIQFTPDLMPADISGTTIVTEVERASGGVSREFTFQPGPIFAQIVLADEINRATPKTQSAMLEAMQERHVTVAGETHHLPEPFFVMATQNPIEQEGTYPLPEAQLDRFFFKLIVGYSSRSEMKEILERTTRQESPTIEPVLDGDSIRRYQALVRMVAIADHVQDYAVRLVLSTHPTGEFGTPMVRKYVDVGASPRAAQALVLAAKCRALVSGRPTVGVEDIQKVAKPALRHRILVNFEADADGIEQDAIIENAVQTLPREQS